MPLLAPPHELFLARRVLIVDDHVSSADLVAQALDLHGYETRVAYEPLTAIAIATEFAPQIALLDINLPTMDGYELGSALRDVLADCKFVALTGDATGLNRLRSQWSGFDGHLTKPVVLEDLLRAVSDTRPSGTFERDAKGETKPRYPSQRPPRERTRIDLRESREVIRYWTTELGCTEVELRAAVDQVGLEADSVRAHLRERRSRPPHG